MSRLFWFVIATVMALLASSLYAGAGFNNTSEIRTYSGVDASDGSVWSVSYGTSPPSPQGFLGEPFLLALLLVGVGAAVGVGVGVLINLRRRSS